MVFKFVTLIAIVATVRAGIIAPASYDGRLYAAAPIAAKAIDPSYDPNPQYSYAYDVQDALTGDYKQQQETRNGDFVQGSYSLLEADGSRRIVDYTADPENGFNAVIRKEEGFLKAAVGPAPVLAAKVAAPVAIAAPIARVSPVYAAPAYASAPAITKIAASPLSYAAPIAHVSYSTPLFSYSH